MEKITLGHSLSQSEDLVKQNLETLKSLFPTIVKEGKIDVEELKSLLGDEVETGDEYYRLTWAGKSMARKETNKPSTATLQPVKDISKNWNTSGNIFIEGDNLEVLKLLQKSYSGQVKMIYIDPPYNTGQDFVYKDNYKDNLSNYLAVTGQINEDGIRLSTNTESDGRYHSNWLNMIYPRLRLARNLLKDDGVIFISIDDREVHNLRKVCDEVFGEENFESMITWRRRHNQPNDKSKMIAKVAEFILVYAKDSGYLKESGNYFGLPLSSDRISDYQNPDNDPNGPWSTNPWKAAVGRGGSTYKITTPTKIVHETTWYGNEETFKKHIADKRVHWTDSGNGFPRIKIYLSEAQKNGQAAINFFNHETFGSNQEASSELKDLFDQEGLFDNPKPVRLIKSLIKVATSENDVILDFFAGSGTTAHAVMEQNSEDRGKRRFICVQLPELTPADSVAYKSGFKTISHLTRERINKAGSKIMGLNIDCQIDAGFKAFKLNSSNIRAWDGDPNNLEQNLFSAATNIKEDRTEEDVLYEILLKYGLDLSVAIEEKTIAGNQVFNIGGGALFICLADDITTAVAEGIGKWKEELQPAICQVIFKDTGFTDVEKTNSVQILKRYGITEVNTI